MSKQQLERIEQLIDQIKFKEALKDLTILDSSEQLTKNERMTLKYLQSTLFLKMGNFKEGQKVAEQLLEESRENGNPRREFDALINTIWALQYLGRQDDGLQLLRRGEKLLKILAQDHQPGLKRRRAAFLHRKGTLLEFKGEQDQILDFLESSLSLREEIGDKKAIAETLYEIGYLYYRKNKLDQILKYGQKSLAISEIIGDQQGIAKSYLLIGWYYHEKGEFDQGLEFFQKSLAISEAIGDQYVLARSIYNIGRVYHGRGELDQALEYHQKSLAIYEVIGYQGGIAANHNSIGVILYEKGEPDQALEHYQKSLVIFETIGTPRWIAMSLNNIGCIYGEKGDFKSNIDHFKRSLIISRKTEDVRLTAETLYQSIRFFANDLPPETVKSYLEELRGINERFEGYPLINQQQRLAEALVLKVRGRLADKMTAQTIFRQVAEEDIVWPELTREALINLSELLLLELKTTGDKAVLAELNELSHRLLTLAKDQRSDWLLVETYLIQSKLKLLELDVHEARQLLTQGHALAKEKGLHRLVRIISIEQDSLNQQLSTWEKIIDQKPSMSEVIKLTQFEDLITRMIHKRLYQNEEELQVYAEKARQLVETWEEN